MHSWFHNCTNNACRLPGFMGSGPLDLPHIVEATGSSSFPLHSIYLNRANTKSIIKPCLEEENQEIELFQVECLALA